MDTTFKPEFQSRLIRLSDDQMKLIFEALKTVDTSKVAHIKSDQFAYSHGGDELEVLTTMFGDDYSDADRKTELFFCL